MTSDNRRLLRASVWTSAGFAAQKGLQLVSNLLLARLLAPEDFGVVAIANVVVVGLLMLSDVGIQQSVYRTRDLTDDYISTAWTLQVIRGCLLGVIACVLAYPVSLIYKNSQLWPLLSFVGLTSVLSGLQTPSVHIYGREIKVLAPTLIRLASQTVALAAALAVATFTRSAWALAVAAVVSAGVDLLLGYMVLKGPRPKLMLHAQSLRDILKYGRWIFLATLLAYFGGQGMTLIQGLMVPLETLGALNIAALLVWPVGELIARLLERVAMPAFAQNHRERVEVLEGFLRLRKVALMLGVPSFLLISLAAEPIVRLLYDARYAASGEYLRIFSANFMITISATCYGQLILAEGDSRTNLQLTALATTLRVLGLLAGYQLSGVVGMLVGAGAASLLVCSVVGALLIRRGVAWRREATIVLFLGGMAVVMWSA